MGLFFEHNLVLVYFFYGLAFFSMGLAVWLESGHTAEFRMARAMGPLAGFGIVHGLHEWFEMFQRLGRAGMIRIPQWLLLDELHLIQLALSFVLLINFGIGLIYYSRQKNEAGNKKLVRLAVGALLVIWLISLVVTRTLYESGAAGFMPAVEVLTRYILGVPGGLLAAWAIVLEQRTFSLRGMAGTGRDLLGAALALFFYAIIGQTFPNQSFLFPSTVVNSDLFLQIFGIPIQLFRGMTAVIMAIFVIRALRAFELESQQQLQAAYRELEGREALRRDLLHRAVTAQEQERQRIARELHDTTGQALTALGLGFAAVGESLQNNPEVASQQVDKLKKLSMQALEELRSLIRNLRPSVLDDLGLVPALQGQVQSFEGNSGVQARFVLNGRRRRLPPEVETIVFRIAQESLNNVARHAAARQVAVLLDFEPNELRLVVEDDGRGFDPQTAYHPQNGRRPWGLLGIEERVLLVGGRCQIESAPGRGTTVKITIPLEQEEESKQ